MILMMSILYTVISVIVVFFIGYFCIQCWMGVLSPRRMRALGNADELNCVILIPAHNEEATIRKTLNSIAGELGANDQVLVVADNCTDSTAKIVREFGFNVTERQNRALRGKGYALAHGLARLTPSPPDIVIVIDADCLVEPGSLSQIKAAVATFNRPVQARYLLKAPKSASVKLSISEFSVMIKNRIRLLGMDRLGLSVPLVGSGMGFLWSDISACSLASGEIVEDMKLGVELANIGRGAKYLDSAVISSYLPTCEQALDAQRQRWEHGHLGIIKTLSLPTLKNAIAGCNVKLALFSLDLMIPPFTVVIAMSVLFNMYLFATVSFLDIRLLLVFVSSANILLGLTLAVVWLRYGREILAVSNFTQIFVYAVKKMGIFFRFFTHREKTWARTKRDSNT